MDMTVSSRRGWAHGEISRLVPGVNLWCGEVLMPACLVYPGRAGAWGCGVVLANMTSSEAHACERLGCALERISETDVVESNYPTQLTFRIIHLNQSRAGCGQECDRLRKVFQPIT